MNTALQDSEAVIAKYGGELTHGFKTTGGHFYLTNRRFIFEPFTLFSKSVTTQFDLSEIAALKPSFVWLMNVIPVMPFALKLSTKDQRTYYLRIFGSRSTLMKAVDEAQSALPAATATQSIW